MKKNKNIVITGGCGFIGSTLVKHILLNTEHNVINIDKLTYAGIGGNLKDFEENNNYFFEKADICNFEKITNIFSKYVPDIIIHLAAESHVDRSIDGPYNFIQSNIIGTFTLLEVSRNYFKNLPSNKTFRFHHVSTDEVYGDLENSDKLFTEDSPYEPSSPYSASKASSDHLVRAWNRTYELPIVITNCSNNYGPYQFPEKLIPLVIMNAIEHKLIPIYGNGQQIRDWLFVEDHAKALLNVAENGILGETYNIGGNNEYTNLDVVQTICSILDELKPINSKKFHKYSDLITFVEDRAGHDRRYAIDSSKMQSCLNWAPSETFNSGLKKTVKWYLENITWCKSIEKKIHARKRLGLNK